MLSARDRAHCSAACLGLASHGGESKASGDWARASIKRARQAGTIDADGPDIRLLLISFTWVLYGYFTGGPIAWNLAEADPFDPEQIAAFRTFVHDYVRRMLDL